MPTDMTRYPKNWPLFSAWVKFTRAKSRCECTGQCGLHGPNPATRRCLEIHHTPAKWAKGTVRLTVAHLCDCDPPCGIPAHVKAMCQRCHLRVDRWKHATNRLQRARMPQDARDRPAEYVPAT